MSKNPCENGCAIAEARGAHLRCEGTCAYANQPTSPSATTFKGDAWALYCETFHQLFADRHKVELSPAALQEFAERLVDTYSVASHVASSGPSQNCIDAQEAVIDIYRDFSAREIQDESRSVRAAWEVGQALDNPPTVATSNISPVTEKSEVTSSISPTERKPDVPLCSGHADAWFCGRNHMPAGFDHCVACCFEEAWKRSNPSTQRTSDPQWITCPATGKQCNDFCDPGKGDACAESGLAFASATALKGESLVLDEHFMGNLPSILRDLDTVLMGDTPADLGGISLVLETLRRADRGEVRRG